MEESIAERLDFNDSLALLEEKVQQAEYEAEKLKADCLEMLQLANETVEQARWEYPLGQNSSRRQSEDASTRHDVSDHFLSP